MKIVQQPEVITRLELGSNIQLPQRHNRLFPNTVRCIIAGPSGVGKTDLLLTLLLHENGLNFKNIYLCAKTVDQEKYRILGLVLKNVKGLEYHTFHDVNEMSIENIKNDSIVIFDDVITSPQNSIIRDIFTFGRHKSIDVIYLAQTLTKVPKHLIRDNTNFFVLFRQDMKNLKNFYNDNISTDLEFHEFVKMCMYCWKDPHGFISINLECNKNDGRYRQSFDKFIIL